MNALIHIADRFIGPGQPCFLIAEAGVNHNGSLDLARRLIDAAADAGADAVKFQTFRTEAFVTPDAPKAGYQAAATDANESQFAMLRRLELPPEAFAELQRYATARGPMFLSTPFDEASADFLATLDVPAYKIPSGEITNLPFLAHVAMKGRPIILSTGMSSMAETRAAALAVRSAGNASLILLHCVSAYPAPPAAMNLRAMRRLHEAFSCPVGLSDHTEGITIAVAAAAMGACVIEKHFTMDRALPGPDHRASLEPKELAQLVRAIREVEAALGDGEKAPQACEQDVAAAVRKSLVTAQDVAAGTILTAELLAAKRPGGGLAPSERSTVIGRRTRRDLPEGTLLTWEMVE